MKEERTSTPALMPMINDSIPLNPSSFFPENLLLLSGALTQDKSENFIEMAAHQSGRTKDAKKFEDSFMRDEPFTQREETVPPNRTK